MKSGNNFIKAQFNFSIIWPFIEFHYSYTALFKVTPAWMMSLNNQHYLIGFQNNFFSFTIFEKKDNRIVTFWEFRKLPDSLL